MPSKYVVRSFAENSCYHVFNRGVSSNTPGVVFTATGAGSGTGTATNGKVSETFSFPGDTPIYVRVRKSSTGATKYVPFSTAGTIKSTGFTLTALVQVDPNA